MVETIAGQVSRYAVVPDEIDAIVQTLEAWADSGEIDLILTTGGTGLSPRDVTPEATTRVLTKVLPGFAEAMRLEGMRHTPRAILSRALAGSRGNTLIINLPGSPKGVRESLGAVLGVIPHSLEILQSRPTDH